MSGRAGRRGLDDRGIVILIVDEKMGPDVGKGLLKVSAMTSDVPKMLLPFEKSPKIDCTDDLQILFPTIM